LLGLQAGSILLLAVSANAADARQIVEEMHRRTHTRSERYEGTLQVIGAEDTVATKHWVFDRLDSFANAKALLRFTAPEEVKGVALLIIAHPLQAADEWIWRPSIGREQRIAFQDRSTRFFGTDFSFEDLEELDVSHFEWKLAGEEKDSWKIEARPRKSSQYTHSYLWVKKDDYTLRQVESYNKDGLARVIHYRDFERVANVWIARTTEVLDVARKSRTILHLDKVEINVPVDKAEFTLESLRSGG